MRITIATLLVIAAACQPAVAETSSAARTAQATTPPPAAAPASPIDPNAADFDKSLGELRKLYTDKKFQAAIPKAHEVVDRAKRLFGERDFRYTGSLINLGLIYSGANQHKEAAEFIKKAFLAQHPLRSPADKDYQQILQRLDDANKRIGQPGDTLQYYTLALTKLNQSGNINSDAAIYYYDKTGQLLRFLAQYDDAEKIMRHALAVRRKISPSESPALVNQLNGLAGLLRARGNFTEAEPLYLEAIRLHSKAKGEWNPSTGILLDNIAVMYLHMGLPDKAEPYQKRALAILEKTLGRESKSTGITLANLAELYRSLGRLSDSEPLFERAVVILNKTLPQNHPHLGYVYDNFAGLYRLQGNHKKAYDTYLKAIRLLKAAHGPNHPEVGVALNNIGLVLGNLGRHKDAEASFNEAYTLTTRAHGKESVILATALGNRADVRISLGKLDDAKYDAERAQKLIRSSLGDQSPKLIFPLTRLGQIERIRGNNSQAFAHFRDAAEIYELTRNRNPGSPDAAEDNGAIDDLVETSYEISQTGSAENRAEAGRIAFHYSQLRTLTSASDALSKLGARLGASDPALRQLARERQDTASAWSKAEKTLLTAVSASPASRNAADEAGLRAQILVYQKRLEAIDQHFAATYPQFAELSRPRPVEVNEIQDFLSGNEVLLQYIVTNSHTYAWAITKDNLQFVKLPINKQQLRMAVQTLRCGLDIAEWIGDTKPLRCLQLTGRSATDEHLPFSTKTAHALYQKLFFPLTDILSSRQLLIVGSDALNRLPMQLLLTAPVPNDDIATLREAPWFVRRHAITVLPSVSSFMVLRQHKSQAVPGQQATGQQERQPYLAIANPLLLGADGSNRTAFTHDGCPPPDRKPATQLVASLIGTLTGYFRGGQADVAQLRRLEPLPETATEVCAVARDLGTPADALLLGATATETELRRINNTTNGLERYAVLHFATHGLVSGELKGLVEPALVLTPPAAPSATDDGLLSASEVAELKLDADWVILSACNTAAASGEGGDSGDALSGLARSFFYAGARSLLVSHWPVRSDAAVALTTRTIRQLAQSPSLGRSRALQRAMLDVIADEAIPSGAHPQVWAPFIVVGEGAARR